MWSSSKERDDMNCIHGSRLYVAIQHHNQTYIINVDSKSKEVPHATANNGSGITMWSDGSTYEGNCEDGLKHGQGIFHNAANGSVYNGEWFRGEKRGSGILNNADGSRYIGQWQSDLPEGDGLLRFVSGNTYEGAWKSGLPHGKGKKTIKVIMNNSSIQGFGPFQ